jgi:hypothetical protein
MLLEIQHGAPSMLAPIFQAGAGKDLYAFLLCKATVTIAPPIRCSPAAAVSLREFGRENSWERHAIWAILHIKSCLFLEVAMKHLMPIIALFFVLSLSAARPQGAGQGNPPLRLGIIGLDTSHVREFTRMLNDPSARDHVPGARVIAAYKGGSPDVQSSASRVEGFTAELRDKWKVEILPDIETLCAKVDAVLLESVDGRVHLEQVKPVLKAKKRVFIDKPLAASLADAAMIAKLAEEAGVPWFSSSSLRFHPAIANLKDDPQLGGIVGCDAYGPSPTESHHPDLFWYGIHGVEILFTIMGPGCQSVTRVTSPGTDMVVGKWKDGRIGTFRGIRTGKDGYGATVFGVKEIRCAVAATSGSFYRDLVEQIIKFFQTGVPPVSASETLELFAFMQAAELSKAKGGQEVSLSDVSNPR